MRHHTQILASCFNTPGEADRSLFHAVLRAGRLRAAPDYAIERSSYPGHDLLVCIAGAGSVRSCERVFPVRVGQLVWIDCHHPHAHWPHPRQPWELLWMRVDGPQMQLLADTLAVRSNPVFALKDLDEAASLFKRVLALMSEHSLTMNAALHAAVCSLVALLFEARQSEVARSDRELRTDPRVLTVLRQMRLHYERQWRIGELARLSGLSVPYFFRRFRKATGSSPIDWLRRERVNQAKRRLSEGRDRIRDIAAQVGYDDPFYFSRDFKRLVGLSPRRYREQEGARMSDKAPPR